ncbi:hypothetical protein, partial [Lactiplantibacillus plantarum]
LFSIISKTGLEKSEDFSRPVLFLETYVTASFFDSIKIKSISFEPLRDLIPMIPGFEDGLLIGANGALIADNRQIKPVASIRSHDLQLVTEMVASD